MDGIESSTFAGKTRGKRGSNFLRWRLRRHEKRGERERYLVAGYCSCRSRGPLTNSNGEGMTGRKRWGLLGRAQRLQTIGKGRGVKDRAARDVEVDQSRRKKARRT